MDVEFDPNVSGPNAPPPTPPIAGVQGGEEAGIQQIPEDTLEEIQGVFDQIQNVIQLEEGKVSMLELSKLITDMIQRLRALLYASEFGNYDLLTNLFL